MPAETHTKNLARQRALFHGGMNAWEKKIYMKWYRFVHDSPENRAISAARTAQWKLANPGRYDNEIDREKQRARCRRYGQTHDRSAYRKEYHARPEVRERRRQSRLKANGGMDRYYNDPKVRMSALLRGRLYRLLKRNGAHKSASMITLLGCSLESFKIYIESLFSPGMTWENQGTWHLDHIIPCALFDLTKPEHQKACFHFSNIQPLWELDNMRKGMKLLSVQPNKALTLPEQAQLGT